MIRPIVRSSIVTVCLVVGAAAPFAMAQDLPDGPGKDVTVKACTSCHDADNFTSKKHTKAEWKEVVDTMVAYGAEVSDADSEIITTYLAKNFGPAGAAPSAPAPSASGAAPGAQTPGLPDGPGKDVVVKACTSCHDADNFTSKKHTKAEWKEVVDTMVAYGAEVSDADSEIITTYLAKYFGKDADAGKAAPPSN